MIDSHSHLYDLGEDKSNIEKIIDRAKKAGVRTIICNGGGVLTSQKAVDLAQKYAEVWATVGIHPEEEAEYHKYGMGGIREKLSELCSNPKVVAIGEAGLDFRPDITREAKLWQEELFQINMELARITKLPLVVHNRNADRELRKLLNTFEGKVQLHCFKGGIGMVEWASERNYYMSIGGIVTFKNGRQVYQVSKLIPDELLLVETDSPHLAPEPHRGERNEPMNVKIIVEAVARARDKTAEEIAQLTSRNAYKLFDLPDMLNL